MEKPSIKNGWFTQNKLIKYIIFVVNYSLFKIISLLTSYGMNDWKHLSEKTQTT